MRALVLVIALAGTASADPVRAPACESAGARIAQVVAAGDHAAVRLVAQRCERDRWSVAARGCFASATTERAAAACLDQLSKDQTRELAGDADRLDLQPTGRRLVQWLSRKPIAAFVVAPAAAAQPLALAVDMSKVRSLHAEGMTAYRAGRYELAVKKWQAANEAAPSPELVYHLAQAHRMKGEYRAALELYEKYVEIAPNGAAAADCHRQIELLVDQP